MIYWTLLQSEEWPLYIAATDEGLCFVGSVEADLEELKAWQQKKRPKATLVEDDLMLGRYVKELQQYFEGKKQCFELPIDLQGTSFQMKVWQALQAIPFGQASTYGEIALKIGQPTAVRAVGGAIGANPVAIVVPCHRVIGKSGSLTGFRGGLEMKKSLLMLEGILASGKLKRS